MKLYKLRSAHTVLLSYEKKNEGQQQVKHDFPTQEQVYKLKSAFFEYSLASKRFKPKVDALSSAIKFIYGWF